MKSSKEKETNSVAPPLPPSSPAAVALPSGTDEEDVTCFEIIRQQIPGCFQAIVQILLCGSSPSQRRPPEADVAARKIPSDADAAAEKIPSAYLQVNDGSCVSSMQVHIPQFFF